MNSHITTASCGMMPTFTLERCLMFWTKQRIELLTALWAEGKAAKEISLLIGGDVSRNAVIGKAHRLGLATRASPIIRHQKDIKNATFLSLTERMCKWPFGDPKKPDFHFCGKAVDVAVTYCAEHRAIAYQAPKKLSLG